MLLSTFCLILAFSNHFAVVFAYDSQSVLSHEHQGGKGNSTGVLNVFQAYKPVTFLSHGASCNQELLLMEHQFAFSYGKPFVGNYEPPKCHFDTVRINFTVTSKGRQFDRLALMFLGDIEVFRTSTAEPTANGIVWTYIKDMSQYNALWKQPQKLIFDLGNLINEMYTGPFNTTLTASFSKQDNVKTPDVILPISSKKSASNSHSAFTLPSDNAVVSAKIPAAASRAVVSISACGQIEEEFWFSNVFSQDMYTFSGTVGQLSASSPFREVQLYIDGMLAGVVWPFPIIFTGGVAPGLWRPIVGIDAFDLRMPEIDITPFLPLLTDGNSHSFEIKVVGLDVQADGSATLSDSIGSYWVVTGTIFLYLDGSTKGSTSKGSVPQIIAPEPTFTTTRKLVQDPETGANISLTYSLNAQRTLTVASPDFTWSQSLYFANDGFFTQQGLSQWNKQDTRGQFVAVPTGQAPSHTLFNYPVEVNTTFASTNNALKIDASLSRSLDISSTGGPGVSTFTLVSGPMNLSAKQWGSGHYLSVKGGSSYSFGDTSDQFDETSGGSSYSRFVRAVNGTVVTDTEGGASAQPASAQAEWSVYAGGSVKGILGRGPGEPGR
ncbi:hypothetical protein AX14_007692 [Amanita brunnescens Koide BX004]|nr:hypothetical protein AX14_007692 [Amanita brunnescens Koide BX004]